MLYLLLLSDEFIGRGGIKAICYTSVEWNEVEDSESHSQELIG